MSFISLKDIGKIYVSEGSVVVGIRGVNLDFELGEFVAVTGKSGSGKSTLLNIISGMDSYEEGELYIEGEPTSHYVQEDWEEYRKNYISFIFQDYNIVESFTVLQNVELALMHIENRAQRRKRALELIERVGLKSHVKHKGSKLSGGQKQRTVIARALAKDSPVLLADEPTGNLDSKTSREIIELLKEVSKDKLVIIVTHNFDQVEEFATRHIRIYDGAVESDRIMAPHEPVHKDAGAHAEKYVNDSLKNTLKNAADLGWVRYKAMPKLSIFVTFIMLLSMLAATLVTATTEGFDIFENDYIFNHIDGRTVISRRDGGIITEEELEELAEELGAESYIARDWLLDNYLDGFECTTQQVGSPDIGRYPENDNEVFLCVPISEKDIYTRLYNGERVYNREQFTIGGTATQFIISGLDFFYDNTKNPAAVFTEKGFEYATAISLFTGYELSFSGNIRLENQDANMTHDMFTDTVFMSFELPENSYSFCGYQWNELLDRGFENYTIINDFYIYVSQKDIYYDIGYGYAGVIDDSVMPPAADGEFTLDEYNFVEDIDIDLSSLYTDLAVVVSPDIFLDMVEENYFSGRYYQASLFFANDREAAANTDRLKELGYTAIPSFSESTTTAIEALLYIIVAVFGLAGWFLSMLFVALFLRLCTRRAMAASSSDIAIMRSMGIPVRVIKSSVYFQTAYSMIPAVILTAVTMAVIYLVPQANGYFIFLHAPQYLLIALAAVIITVGAAKGYNKAMFRQSVKKTLTKGDSK